jgi:hypothetical protein
VIGFEGVGLDQVQRAFETWLHPAVGGRKAPGGRSLVDAGIRERVNELAASTACRTDRKELTSAFRRLVESSEPFDLPGQPFVDAVLQAAFPDGPHSIRQRQFAESIWNGIRLQSVTIRHVQSILIHAAEVRAFWEWAARQIRRGLGEYVQDLENMQADPDFGRLFSRPTLNEFVNSSCNNLSVVMGAGIAVLKGYEPFQTPEGYEAAPKINLT